MAADPTPEQYLRDLDTMSGGDLRRKYELTYTAWRNMKNRAKGHVAPEFMAFRDFLRHMGPCPAKGVTLDRIDNNNARYGPGLCRWADKRQQANNRSSTRMIPVASGGRVPLAEAAARAGQNLNTVRSRLGRGWSADDALAGRRGSSEFGSNPFHFNPWSVLLPEQPDRQREWEERYWRKTTGRIDRISFFLSELTGRRRVREREIQGMDAAGLSDEPQRATFSDEIDRIDRLLRLGEDMMERWEKAATAFTRANPRFSADVRRPYILRGGIFY